MLEELNGAVLQDGELEHGEKMMELWLHWKNPTPSSLGHNKGDFMPNCINTFRLPWELKVWAKGRVFEWFDRKSSQGIRRS